MDNRNYAEIMETLRNSYEAIQPDKRAEFTKDLEKVLRELICRNVREDVPAVTACPHCHVCDNVKFGRTESGKQRYRCSNCGRTYTSESHRNLLSNSKLPMEIWLAYCGCFANMCSLRKSAGICGISLYTSFFMRRRMLEILFQMLPPFRAEAGVNMEIDEMYLRESFKGSNVRERVPRPSRKRGHGSGPGLNKGLVCVVTGINDVGDIFFDIAGRGKPSCDRIRSVLERRVCSGCIVTTDREQSYVSVLRSIGVGEHEAHDDREYGHLPNINSYHSRIRHFLHCFKGVSTRWLAQYLGWQKFCESFEDISTDRYILGRIIQGHYSITRSKMYCSEKGGIE